MPKLRNLIKGLRKQLDAVVNRIDAYDKEADELSNLMAKAKPPEAKKLRKRVLALEAKIRDARLEASMYSLALGALATIQIELEAE